MQAIISQGYAPGCIGRIAQLHASYYSAHHGFGLEFEAKVAREMGDFFLNFAPGRDGAWLAQCSEIEGSIFLDGTRAEASGAHLRWFITTEKIRGLGIGRRLLLEALAFADARNYKKTYLWTFKGLDAARHLYESCGFRLVHQSHGKQWGTVVNEQRFEREA